MHDGERATSSSRPTQSRSARSPPATRPTRSATSSSYRSADRAVSRVAQLQRAQQVDGFRLQDGRASYGIGLETFALGFPIHFDWSWRTLLNKDWEDVVFACTAVLPNGACVNGADDFRKPRFAVWIGYDF